MVYDWTQSTPDDQMLKETTELYEIAWMSSADEARGAVMQALAPKEGEVSGLMPTTPLHWNYASESMWRGDPDNRRVLKLGRSIISSCFNESDGAIASRTLCLSASHGKEDVRFSLLFGDGSARGVSACLVWMLFLKHRGLIPQGDVDIYGTIQSLWTLPTNFERHGSGTPQECLLAQAARQNANASVLPVSTLQWMGMIIGHFGLKVGSGQHSTAAMEKAVQALADAYNQQPLVEAYQVDVPPTKKRRTNKPKKADGNDSIDHGLAISRRRLIAMKSFLAGGTETGLQMLNVHLVVMSDWSVAVLTDNMMGNKWFYVGSRLPVDLLPTEVALANRDATSAMAKALVPDNFTAVPVQFDTQLTPKQFDMMLNKAIHIYESAALEEVSDEAKARHRPTEETWQRYRVIVQRWDESVSLCASKDLSTDDFKLLEETVLRSDTMDNDLMAVLTRFPPMWHMGLIPHILGEQGPSKDEQLASLTVKQQAVEQAQFDKFVAEVHLDWSLIDEVHTGYLHPHDILAWNDNRHRVAQASKGELLVKQHMADFFPLCETASWDKVSTQLHILAKSWDASLTGKRRVVILMDFNCPGARDTLRLSQMVAQAANVSSMFGHSNVCVLAWMPNLPKEGSQTTAEDDEQTIKQCLSKVGLKTQLRVRMLLDPPETARNMTSQMDWWADGRLCFFGEAEDNFWRHRSELARTRRVNQKGMLPEAYDMVDLTSLNPDDDINTSCRIPDLSDKMAQRGPDVAEAQLSALFTKSACKHGSDTWLCSQDDTLIVDFHHCRRPRIGRLPLESTARPYPRHISVLHREGRTALAWEASRLHGGTYGQQALQGLA